MTTGHHGQAHGTVTIGDETIHFEAGRTPDVGDDVVVIDPAGRLVVVEMLGSFGGHAVDPWLTHVRLAGSASNVRDIVPLVGTVLRRTATPAKAAPCD